MTLVAEGHRPVAGEILLSGTDDHLVLGEDRGLHYSVEPRESSLPSLGRRVLRQCGPELAQAGRRRALDRHVRDGAEGLLTLRRLGWRTIAQDESSSVVWGMPKAAVEIGAAEEVLPLSQIAEAIARLMPRSDSDRPARVNMS